MGRVLTQAVPFSGRCLRLEAFGRGSSLGHTRPLKERAQKKEAETEPSSIRTRGCLVSCLNVGEKDMSMNLKLLSFSYQLEEFATLLYTEFNANHNVQINVVLRVSAGSTS